MRKLIVLDFDGVLNTWCTCHGKQTPNRNCVAHLNRILSVTHASVLVSSAWRGATVGPMRAQLQTWGVWGHVVGVTPDLTKYVPGHPFVIAQTRETEIQTWLSTHRPYDRIVVLDDEPGGFIELLPNFVQCSMEAGLTEDLALLAITLLEGGV